MHGVGGASLLRAFEAAGFDPPFVVAEQQEPDGTFPTVSFPNPEEPGAMDLLIDTAARSDAVVAIANDPDADRLGAAIPAGRRSWRRLGGDEIGWLLADHILATRSATTGSWSPRWCRRRCWAAWRRRRACTATRRSPASSGSARSPPNARPAVRVRLRAGARLPRGAATARQGRHHGGGADGRDRRGCGGRRRHAAGSSRRRSPTGSGATSRPSCRSRCRRPRALRGWPRSKPTRRRRSVVGP